MTLAIDKEDARVVPIDGFVFFASVLLTIMSNIEFASAHVLEGVDNQIGELYERLHAKWAPLTIMIEHLSSSPIL